MSKSRYCLIRIPVALGIAMSLSAFEAREASAAGDEDSPTKETRVSEHKHTNRLINSTSPYLLQHAHNPVDWHEWDADALARAKKEDKPIFLSIGYAACHWCHVMEHESFESEEVAAHLNEHFVCIKVDREERPDIDEIYMAYTVETSRGGGWPMSVWLMPDGSPFYSGTYYPRETFMEILKSIASTWVHDRERIMRGANSAQEWLAAWSAGPPKAEGIIAHDVVDRMANMLTQYFDQARGGISGGGTNKFPPSMAMELMLRSHARSGNPELLKTVNVTLDNMARGGIYDHIGGGICRYSTDIEWHVPHFEKMLYDQALVSGIYLDGFLATGIAAYADVAADIFDYVMEDLQSQQGGFYSSRDADSDGLEGAFYIWTLPEIESLLGSEDARLFCAYYDVSQKGNWFERMGHAPAGPKNVLRILKPLNAFVKEHQLDADQFSTKLKTWRETLKQARDKRTHPALDDKVLTGWNGLMIASLAHGARVLENPKYAEAAASSARFILDNMRKDGRLLRSYRNGHAHLSGYLSDYSFLIAGLLNLYEATFDHSWLAHADELTRIAIEHYYDDKGGGFYFTADDAEALVARSKSPRDGAIPSGNSVMAENLLRLSILLDNKDYRTKAEAIFQAFARQVESNPGAFENLLSAVDFYHDRVSEIAIVGTLDSTDTDALVRTAYRRFLPNKVIVASSGEDDSSKLPLMRGKTRRDGRATAYVCENYQCKLPVNDPDELAKLLHKQ
ncbi:MAG: thioredoxin domain-containing protein [Planctomycetota bacterium]|jgi:uncharacterized protein YyaL (SSP411 family)